MTVTRVTWVTREEVRLNRHKLYVFGDNMEGKGYGGQAAAMRGEPNAVGIPTKWRPGRSERDYFTDDDIRDRNVWHAIHGAFDRLRAAIADGIEVMVPQDGVGTGLAELPTRAPKMHLMIEGALRGLERSSPWPPAAGETTEEIVRRSASPNPDSPEQVEAVARALACDDMKDTWNELGFSGVEDAVEEDWTHFKDKAMAALAALRDMK